MAFAPVKRFFSSQAPILILIALLLGSLYLISSATQNSEQFNRLYIPLLLINAIELLILAGLIVINLSRLIRQYRSNATGSRLTVRLVVLFVVLSVGPVSVLYYFSLGFVRHGIDSWFDVRVDEALDDALNLSRTSLDWRMRGMMRQAEYMAGEIADLPIEKLLLSLNDMRLQMGASELVLVSSQGRVMGFSSDDPSTLTPAPVDRIILSQLAGGLAYVGIDSIPGKQAMFARLVVNVPASILNSETRILQALFPVPAGIKEMLERVQSTYAEYERMQFMSGPLKFSFTLSLSIILLLSIFTAVWAAFYLARRLVAPIRVLAIGTRAVAMGEYQRRLPMDNIANDELGFLVKSFNTMMGRIARAQDEADISQKNMEGQKVYLETVLGHLSSGVMTFDSGGVLRTVNQSANHILKADLSECVGKELGATFPESFEHIQGFNSALRQHLLEPGDSWQEEITVFGTEGRQVLMCRGVRLPAPNIGMVVVFDDVTALIRAQRDAAWGEVARRLAHEIKNPLTPIQLSAERLRHKYLAEMSEEDARLLDRSTNTIIQQVDTMKEMVKAFSDYARTPKLNLKPLDLLELTQQVLELYRFGHRDLQIETDFDSSLGLIDMDSGRMRQLLHNLIKNAIEAIPEQTQPRIKISVHLASNASLHAVEFFVEDNGEGIPEAMIGKLFEPYVSAKPKGSGLGLAIVKKIVEEHNGVIWADNIDEGGARFSMRLPLHRIVDKDQTQTDEADG